MTQTPPWKDGRGALAALPGVHKVRVRLASGVGEYWYAWRGGPRILAESAPGEAALKVRVARASSAAGEAYHRLKTDRNSADGFLAGLIYAWQASPEFAGLGERTRRDIRKHLGVIRDGSEAKGAPGLGSMPVNALEARRARLTLIEWRNHFAATPCTADQYMATLQQLLTWARDQGHTDANPLAKFPRLYRVDRSAVIWTPDEIEALCAKAEPELQRAILVAALSGLRQGDLLRLTWSDVGDKVITRTTAKRKRVVHVPITAELRKVLDACPKDTPYVLTKAGAPWKVSTLEKRFSIARKACGLEGKRWHDLRGTYATLLAQAGVEVSAIARIMGWQKEAADDIVTRYVSGEVVALAAVRRLARFTSTS